MTHVALTVEDVRTIYMLQDALEDAAIRDCTSVTVTIPADTLTKLINAPLSELRKAAQLAETVEFLPGEWKAESEGGRGSTDFLKP